MLILCGIVTPIRVKIRLQLLTAHRGPPLLPAPVPLTASSHRGSRPRPRLRRQLELRPTPPPTTGVLATSLDHVLLTTVDWLSSGSGSSPLTSVMHASRNRGRVEDVSVPVAPAPNRTKLIALSLSCLERDLRAKFQLLMDPEKGFSEDTQMAVVLMIPGEGAAAALGEVIRDTKEESSEDFSNDANAGEPKSPSRTGSVSPEIAESSSLPKKPHRPPQTGSLVRRFSISKPKSRFLDQCLPPAAISVGDGCSSAYDRVLGSPHHGSPNSQSFGLLTTPSHADDEEEEEEDDFKKQQFSDGGAARRKCKIRVLIEWAILILAMACLATSVTISRLQEFVIWGLEIWKWCLMVIVICCGRLVTYWLVTIFVFLIERNFLLRKKVLYFVYGLQDCVRICIWLALILVTWAVLFCHGIPGSPKTMKALNYVTRALSSLLIGSVLWLVKILLVKTLASSFHMNTFFDRIQESIVHQYVLQTLSGPPLMELAEKVGDARVTSHLSFRSTGKQKGKGKGGEGIGVIDVRKLKRMGHEKVSAWTMKGLINVIRGTGLSTISSSIESFDEEESEQEDKEITSEWEAKAAAFQIFENVAKPGYK
ncbi:hypothetical protein GW17_00023251 [Ensete ventricosum]|nr:hypothetical protein GW17_00023251 [Ensete ventricosum]